VAKLDSEAKVFYDEKRQCWVGTHPKWGDHVVLAPTKEQAEEDLAFALTASVIGTFRS
jgi:hypothetical protein